MNNRKQQINSFLDGITAKELEDYIKGKALNNKTRDMLEKIRRHRPEKHYDKITEKINTNINKGFGSYYNLGMAWVISFVLVSFYDDKYKIKDLQQYLKLLLDQNTELKEFTYDLMKDW